MVTPRPGAQRLLIPVKASSIKPQRVRWLWEDRIALGTLALLAGREGLGKSTVAVAEAAAVTRGTLPGEMYGCPRDVVYLASEDSREFTIVPRLMAAGADLDRVVFVDCRTELTDLGSISLPLDTDAFRQLVAETDAALIVLDAATSVIDPALDGNSDRAMRTALEMIAHIAEEAGASALGIVHFGKRDSTDIGKLILGTVAWSQVARSVLAVARDEDTGDCVMSLEKSNLGSLDVPSQAFRLVDTVIETEGGDAHVGRVEWLGDTDRSVRQILESQNGDSDGSRSEAARWLKDALESAGGTLGAAETQKAASRDSFTVDQLKRARARLGVKAHKAAFHGGWVWSLPGVALDTEPEKAKKAPTPPSSPSSPSPGRLEVGQ